MKLMMSALILLSIIFYSCSDDSPTTSSYSDLWEDFESGTIDNYPWQSSGDNVWQISTTRKWEGLYSIKSGSIENNETSSFSISLDLSKAGIVYFACNISSESSYDWLYWKLNGVTIDGISGILAFDDWYVFSFHVPPGQHTVEWVYDKDGSYSSGSDAAWLDGILITNYSLNKLSPLPELPNGVVLWSQKK